LPLLASGLTDQIWTVKDMIALMGPTTRLRQ
jgi:hypothetical protein